MLLTKAYMIAPVILFSMGSPNPLARPFEMRLLMTDIGKGSLSFVNSFKQLAFHVL